MFNDSYLEHMDHEAGCASELQNAYALSMMERKPDDTAKINILVAAGRFVVVEQYPIYCPRTDAGMGIRKHCVGDYATRAEAELAAGAMMVDPDSNIGVLPYLPIQIPASEPIGADETPF